MRFRILVAATCAAAAVAGPAAAVPAPPTVSGGSASWINAVSVPVTATGAGPGESYEYRLSLDSGMSWGTPWAGDTAVVGLDGETWVQFRVDDGVTQSAWAPTHTPGPDAGGLVRIDRLAPPITPAPTAAAITTTDPVLSWDAAPDAGSSGVVAYRVLRGGTQVAETASLGFTDTGQADGTYQYRLVAVDAAGNASLQSPVRTVVRDATAPTAATVAGGSLVPSSSATVRVSASGASDATSGLAGYEWRISDDGGLNWSAPSAGAVVDVAREGETLVQFRARDVAGNAGAWAPAHLLGDPAAGGTVRLDRVPPVRPPAPYGVRYPLVIGWQRAADADLYALVRNGVEIGRVPGTQLTDLDATDLVAPPAPAAPRVQIPARGRVLLSWPAVEDRGTEYRYALRAVDLAGNTSPESPVAPITARSGTAGYVVRMDGRVIVEADATSAAVGGLDPDRTYTFTLQARDAAGRTGEESPSLGVRPIPGPDPRLTVTAERLAARTGEVFRMRATVRGVASGPVRWDFGDGSTATGNRVEHAYGVPGRRTVTIEVTGATGRPVRVRRPVVVDDDAPRLSAGVTGNLLRARAVDPLSGVAEVRVLSPVAQPVGAAGVLIPDGRHVLRVRAVDRAGNATLVEREVLVDATVPRLRVTAPRALAATSADVTVSAGDATSGLAQLTLDGRPLADVAGGLVRLRTGRRHVIGATDARGNTARAAVFVARVPSAPLRHPALDGARGDQLWFRPAEPRLRGVRRTLLREVQARMVAVGALPASWRTTDRYSEPLLRRVQAYQRDAGLPGIGTVGPSTRRALARDARRPVVITGR